MSGSRAADPTPFDSPWFLPALFAAFAAWFGYDGWCNDEIEAVRFNRIGCAVWAALALYTGAGALRETRRARAGAAPERDPSA